MAGLWTPPGFSDQSVRGLGAGIVCLAGAADAGFHGANGVADPFDALDGQCDIAGDRDFLAQIDLAGSVALRRL